MNVTKLKSTFAQMEQTIEQLQKEVKQLKRLQENESAATQVMLKEFKSEQSNAVYDGSAAGIAVYENMENFYKKNSHRWVVPCDWKDCRTISFFNVVFNLMKQVKETLQTEIKVIQLGKLVMLLS